MPAFLCSVPLPVSRPLFLFCRMLSGLFVCLFPGIECRLSSFCSRVFSPAPPFVHSPAFNAGFYFVHCAMENCLDLAIRTGGAAGSDAPTQTLIRLFRRTGRPADTLVYKSHTHAWVCIVLGKGCQPVSRQPLPSIFFEFWCKDRHKKTSLKFRNSFGNDGTISVLKRYSQMILL